MIRHALLILLLACPAQALAQDQARGLELWSKIHQVLSHPRCANCHVGPDHVPMWSDAEYGAVARPHGMNINAGKSRDGAEYLACTTCHTQHNSDTPHGPPGSAIWKLPAVERQWFGKSSAEICDQIKDPVRSGKPSIEAVAKHIREDELVGWGWEPGPGRTPAPYSVNELADFVEQWNSNGAPCPVK